MGILPLWKLDANGRKKNPSMYGGSQMSAAALTSVPESIARIIAVLTSHSYRASNEAALQAAIANVFNVHHVTYERERKIGARERVDFLVTASCGRCVGVEVKMKGAMSAVALQLHRYAESPEVHALILATTLHRLTSIPDEMAGKPVYAVRLPNGMF